MLKLNQLDRVLAASTQRGGLDMPVPRDRLPASWYADRRRQEEQQARKLAIRAKEREAVSALATQFTKLGVFKPKPVAAMRVLGAKRPAAGTYTSTFHDSTRPDLAIHIVTGKPETRKLTASAELANTLTASGVFSPLPAKHSAPMMRARKTHLGPRS